MPPSNEELAEIKAALNPGFEYDPDRSQTYNEQLEVYRYPLKQILEQQKYAGQHDPYYSDLPASENDANTAQAIQDAADANAVVNKEAKLQKVAALLNDPNTPDAERLELYDQLDTPEAREKFNNKFPGLLPQPSLRVAPVDNILSVKEKQAQAFSAKLQAKKQQLDAAKKQSAIAIAKAKFQKQPIPSVQPREVPTISTSAAPIQQVSTSIPDQTEFTVPSVDTPVEPQRSVGSTAPVSEEPQDLSSLLDQDYTNPELRELINRDYSDPALKQVLEPTGGGLDNASPVVQSNGRVSEHEDGTWSIKFPDGKVLGYLDEVTAKSFSKYNLADVEGLAANAPQGGPGEIFNRVMQSLSTPAEQGAQAIVGGITLTEQVEAYNYPKESLFSFTDRNVTKDEIEQYKEINSATTPLTSEQKVFKNSDKFKTISNLETKAAENRAQYDAVKEFAQDYRNNFPVNRKHLAGATEAYKVIAKNEGNLAALANAIGNDFGTFLEVGYDSVGYTIALTAGGIPTQMAVLATLAKGKATQAVEEFVTREKRDPTPEELTRIKVASAVGVVFEKVSAGYLVKTINRVVPGGQLAWTRKVKAAIDKSTPASVLNLSVVKPGSAVLSEGSQGIATEISDQIAQTGKIDNWDAVVLAGAMEAAGMPGTAAGMVGISGTYKATKGVAKAAFGINKAQNKSNIEKQLGLVEEQLAEINKRERLESITDEDGPFSQAAEQERKITPDSEVIALEDINASKDIKRELEEVRKQIEEVKRTGKAVGEQLDLGLDIESTTEQSEAATQELLELEKKEEAIVAQLQAPISPELADKIKADAIKLLEQRRNALRSVVQNGDFSSKAINKILKEEQLKGDPADGTAITDDELKKVLDDIEVVQSTSSLQKLKNVAKRGLTSGQKTKVKTILDKSLDKVLNAGETAFSIFGSNFLEGALDSDNLTIDQLEQEKEQALTDKDKQLIDQVIVAKKLKEQLEREEKSTIDKSLEEVDTEALEGQSARWKGLNTYRKEIIKLLKEQDAATNDLAKRRLTIPINNLIAKLRNHAGNLNRKITAFKEASVAYDSLSLEDKKLASGKGVIIIGKRKPNSALREMAYEVAKDSNGKPLVLTEEQFKAKRKAGLKSGKSNKREYVFKVGGNSKSIIRTLQNEANFGNATVGVIEGYKDTSYNTTLEEQKSQRLANKELETELQSIKLDLQEPEKEATAEEISAVELETDAPPVEPASSLKTFKEGDIVNVWSGAPTDIESNLLTKSPVKITKIFDEGKAGVYAQVEGENTLHPIKNLELLEHTDGVTPEQRKIAELEEELNDLKAQVKGQSKTGTETGQSQSETPTPSETTTTPTSTTESSESLVDEETGEFTGDTSETPFRPDEFEQQESSTTTEEEESTEEIDTVLTGSLFP